MNLASKTVPQTIHERYVVRLPGGQFVAKLFLETEMGLAASIDSAKLFVNVATASWLARMLEGSVITVLVDERFQNARVVARHEARTEKPQPKIDASTVQTLSGMKSVYSGDDLSDEIERAL